MKVRLLTLALALAGLASSASAALIDRGNGLIYDSTLNVTWLKDANLAASQTFGIGDIDPDGAMTLATANDWISAMNLANYKGYSDWTLPLNTPINGVAFNEIFTSPGFYNGLNTVDIAYNITSTKSPLAHLYYVTLGNVGLRDTAGNTRSGVTGVDYGMVNTGPFENVLDPLSPNGKKGYTFWTGVSATKAAGFGRAWEFTTQSGYQFISFDDSYVHAWAMRAGDVAAVPEPASVALLLGGLGLVGLAARRRRA